MKSFHIILIAALLASCSPSGQVGKKVAAPLKDEVLQLAEANLAEKPVTVTAASTDRSSGSIHDFYSEGDYWWPNPEDPDGPYIRRDGETNPDNFVAHRHAMVRFSQIVGNLTSAYLLTGQKKYAEAVVPHVKAWFIDPETMMNPNLLYAQAIKGVTPGRGIGIIDTIHLIEVSQSLLRLHEAGVLPQDVYEESRKWFADHLNWLTTHKNGVDEMNAKNNHGTCWALQAASFAQYAGRKDIVDLCKDRYKNIFLPTQMATDGSFPQELARTKPYGYSLFNLDAMAGLCQILSTKEEDLWDYTTPDGKNMRKAIEFILPYIKDKSTWPYAHDEMYWDEWPVAHPTLIFAWARYKDDSYYEAWLPFDHFPTNEEVVRNLALRNPVIWLY